MTHLRPIELSERALNKLSKVSTATLTSQLIVHGFRNTYLNGVLPLNEGRKMIGYAVTMRFVPAREDMPARMADLSINPQRLAVESVGPGDVLIMAAGGETRSAVIGDIFAQRIAVLGAAGFVTDGALRDTPGCQNIDLPIYLKTMQATRSNVHLHPADWNVQIGCGGVLIEPGDIIVGDDEGVVAIPARVAESVVEASYEQEVREMHILELVKAGRSTVGIYPPSDETQAEFEAWRKGKGL